MINLVNFSKERPTDAILDSKVISFRIYETTAMQKEIRSKVEDRLNAIIGALEQQGKVLNENELDVEIVFSAFLEERKFQIIVRLNSECFIPLQDATVRTVCYEVFPTDPEYNAMKEQYFALLKRYFKSDIVRMETIMSKYKVGDLVYGIVHSAHKTKKEIQCPNCNGVGYTLKLDKQEIVMQQKILASAKDRWLKCPNCSNGVIIREECEYSYWSFPVRISGLTRTYRKQCYRNETVYTTEEGDFWEDDLCRNKEEAEQRCTMLNNL